MEASPVVAKKPAKEAAVIEANKSTEAAAAVAEAPTAPEDGKEKAAVTGEAAASEAAAPEKADAEKTSNDKVQKVSTRIHKPVQCCGAGLVFTGSNKKKEAFNFFDKFLTTTNPPPKKFIYF